MILSIESSLSTFKSVQFRKGLNVLVADTQPGATEKQTRNSAGKTSLVEVVHFIFGADCEPDSIFRTPELINHSFSASLMLGSELFKVERSGAAPSKIFVLEGGRDRQDLKLKIEKASERLFVSNTNWKTFLGHVHFGLPADLEGSLFDESFTPGFRSMFSYFARRRNSGGFLSPERQAEKQQRWDWQVNLSYLFGLDWRVPHEFQKVRSREKTLEELRKAAKGGALGDLLGTVAGLRPQVTVAETKASKLRDQLANFEVLDSYRDLSRRAARARTDLQALGREAVGLHETLNHLQQALAAEAPPNQADLQQLYSTVGVELPGIALRRFEEVSRFHESIVANRRSHLHQEISEAEQKIATGEGRMKALDVERRDVLKTLEGRGALEDFLGMQRDLAALEASAASLRERYKAAEILEGESTQLDLDRVNLKRRLQDDHHQRGDALDSAILVVADAIGELYGDRAGRFVVEATDNGPEFRIVIEGDRGGGIANMEIFCLDITLFRLVANRYGGGGFLMHDSHLFDGVDERQVASALLLGSNAAAATGSQYIVTMNSDIFDRLPLSDELKAEEIVLPTRLSDATETGGLFGLRF